MAKNLIDNSIGYKALLDAYGLPTSSLGNDLIFESARGIIFRDLVEVPYVESPRLNANPISDRPQNFISGGIYYASQERIPLPWGIRDSPRNVETLLTGDGKVNFSGGKSFSYPNAIDILVGRLQAEAHQIIEEHAPVDALYRTVPSLPSSDAKLRRYKEVLRRDPKHSRAALYAGQILAAKGQFEEALNFVNQALRHRPNDPATLNQRGVLLQRKGKMPEAIATYEMALEANPGYTKALFNLGVLLEKKGDKRRATELFKEAASRGDKASKRKLK